MFCGFFALQCIALFKNQLGESVSMKVSHNNMLKSQLFPNNQTQYIHFKKKKVNI